MLITITSPRKGVGQTIFSIVFASLLSKESGAKTNLTDLNTFRDIDLHLSNAQLTRSLDDFCLLYDTKQLNDESFERKCTKHVRESLHISDSNVNYNLNDTYIDSFVEHSNRVFDFTVVDSISGKNQSTKNFLKRSDLVICLLPQDKNLVNQIAEYNSLYQQNKDKLIFIVNRYMSEFNRTNVKYDANDILSDLNSMGYNCPVFISPFSPLLMNEANEKTLLNFSFKSSDEEYATALEEIVKYTTEKWGALNAQHETV